MITPVETSRYILLVILIIFKAKTVLLRANQCRDNHQWYPRAMIFALLEICKLYNIIPEEAKTLEHLNLKKIACK